MGEIWSCVKPRTKLDGLLSDSEREQLLEIYEVLKIDKSKPMLLGRLRTQLYYVVLDMKKRGILLGSLWEDWQEFNFQLRHSLAKQPDQTEIIDKLGFLHLWKTFGSGKRHTFPGSCCNVVRRRTALADYDEQRWKLHQMVKKSDDT